VMYVHYSQTFRDIGGQTGTLAIQGCCKKVDIAVLEMSEQPETLEIAVG